MGRWSPTWVYGPRSPELLEGRLDYGAALATCQAEIGETPGLIDHLRRLSVVTDDGGG